jgi:hypothetical protein
LTVIYKNNLCPETCVHFCMSIWKEIAGLLLQAASRI